MEVFLRYHEMNRRGKGLVGFIITDEQWEHVNQWPSVDDGFRVPRGLWPFIVLNFRETLGLDEGEIHPLVNPVLWRPNDLKLIPDDVPMVDLSRLPIEVWHPESPPVVGWPFPSPVSDPP